MTCVCAIAAVLVVAGIEIFLAVGAAVFPDILGAAAGISSAASIETAVDVAAVATLAVTVDHFVSVATITVFSLFVDCTFGLQQLVVEVLLDFN